MSFWGRTSCARAATCALFFLCSTGFAGSGLVHLGCNATDIMPAFMGVGTRGHSVPLDSIYRNIPDDILPLMREASLGILDYGGNYDIPKVIHIAPDNVDVLRALGVPEEDIQRHAQAAVERVIEFGRTIGLSHVDPAPLAGTTERTGPLSPEDDFIKRTGLEPVADIVTRLGNIDTGNNDIAVTRLHHFNALAVALRAGTPAQVQELTWQCMKDAQDGGPYAFRKIVNLLWTQGNDAGLLTVGKITLARLMMTAKTDALDQIALADVVDALSRVQGEPEKTEASRLLKALAFEMSSERFADKHRFAPFVKSILQALRTTGATQAVRLGEYPHFVTTVSDPEVIALIRSICDRRIKEMAGWNDDDLGEIESALLAIKDRTRLLAYSKILLEKGRRSWAAEFLLAADKPRLAAQLWNPDELPSSRAQYALSDPLVRAREKPRFLVEEENAREELANETPSAAERDRNNKEAEAAMKEPHGGWEAMNRFWDARNREGLIRAGKKLLAEKEPAHAQSAFMGAALLKPEPGSR